EKDFGLGDVLPPGWNQDPSLDTDSGFMDFVLPEAMELNDLDRVHSSNDSSSKALLDQCMHKRPAQSMRDEGRRCNSRSRSSPITSRLNEYSRAPQQGRQIHRDVCM